MWSPSQYWVWPPRTISIMPHRYRACVVSAHGGHLEVTPDINLESMKYKGSLVFGSVYTSKTLNIK